MPRRGETIVVKLLSNESLVYLRFLVMLTFIAFGKLGLIGVFLGSPMVSKSDGIKVQC